MGRIYTVLPVMAKKKYNLPRPHLSYSAIDLWYKNKNQYRERYYEGKKSFDTVYTMFGRESHEQIDADPKFADIRLPESEKEMVVRVSGVPIRGYIDTYNPDTHAFGEYKTGIRKPDGSCRWTQYDVDLHDQLPFYSLLLQEKYGVKVNKTYLVWLETEFCEDKLKKGGVVLSSGRKLRLTGEMERFDRKIYQYDRDRMRKWIINAAKEIEEDYERWRKENNK